MPDHEAVSPNDALLVRKGAASAAGFLQSTFEAPCVAPVARETFVAALTPAGGRPADADDPRPDTARPSPGAAARLATVVAGYPRRLEWSSPLTIAFAIVAAYLAGLLYVNVADDEGAGAPAVVAMESGTASPGTATDGDRGGAIPANRPHPSRRVAPPATLSSFAGTAPPSPETSVSLRREPPAPPGMRPENGPPVPTTSRGDDGYLVQLYALRTDAAVRRAWPRLQRDHADLFGGLRLIVERVDLGAGKGDLFRLQAGLLESQAAARKLCARARRQRLDCIVVRPRAPADGSEGGG